jgi:hypothetical protein
VKRLICLLLVLAGTVSAQAQKTRFYVRGGVNSAHYAGPDAVRVTSLVAPSGLPQSKPFFYTTTPTGNGLLFGPVGGIGLCREGAGLWGVRTELNYQERGSVTHLVSLSSVLPVNGKLVLKTHSLTLPVLLQYRIGSLGRVAAGAYVSYRLNHTEDVSTENQTASKINHQPERTLRRVDVGGALSLEVPIWGRFAAELRYQRGFLNAYAEEMGRQSVAYYQDFQLTVSYFLN